ncbi:hypothetical protein [Streptomyces somaliensis]|uniref:hypothetical protein n=1 Tax=Streptomyces somaliensis TaxID=78355 RepID=UPI0034E93485|nr:hypothetical protein [Streptomyces somaliensis]
MGSDEACAARHDGVLPTPGEGVHAVSSIVGHGATVSRGQQVRQRGHPALGERPALEVGGGALPEQPVHQRGDLAGVPRLLQRGGHGVEQPAQHVAGPAAPALRVHQQVAQPVPGGVPVGGLEQLRGQWGERLTGLLRVQGGDHQGPDQPGEHHRGVGPQLHVGAAHLHGG